MKGILITLLCLGVTHTVFSTNDSLPHINFYLGIGGGRIIQGKIFGLNLTTLKQGGYGIQIKNQANNTLSKQLPLDYRCATYLGAMNCGTEDLLRATSIKLVRQFSSHFKWVRYGLEVGPSFISHKIAQFKPNSHYLVIDGVSNHFNYYNTTYIKNNAIGLDIRAKIELPFLTIYGAEFGVTSNINKLRSFVGYELILNIGLVKL